jgi:methylated-DNA-[protein]-cysteine S-methyltransferase
LSDQGHFHPFAGCALAAVVSDAHHDPMDLMAPQISVRTETRYCLFDCALGACGIGWSEHGVIRFLLPEGEADVTEQRLRQRTRGIRCVDPPPAITALIGDLRHYFDGAQVDFSYVAVDFGGVSEFEHTVFLAARSVGWGRTTTYGELARAVGHPEAAREVGQAMGRNRVPVIIPCHRVLAAGGKMGGFSAPGGTETKRRLLELEGVGLAVAAPRLPGF